jgi:hypothetical protein
LRGIGHRHIRRRRARNDERQEHERPQPAPSSRGTWPPCRVHLHTVP